MIGDFTKLINNRPLEEPEWTLETSKVKTGYGNISKEDLINSKKINVVTGDIDDKITTGVNIDVTHVGHYDVIDQLFNGLFY